MVVRRSTLQRSGDKNVSQTPFKPICVQYRSPQGPSFCSCKRKQNRAKGNQAFPFANPFDAKLRLDTNDALASSVRRRRYALKVPAAHFILDFAGTELKINLISVVASDATFA